MTTDAIPCWDHLHRSVMADAPASGLLALASSNCPCCALQVIGVAHSTCTLFRSSSWVCLMPGTPKFYCPRWRLGRPALGIPIFECWAVLHGRVCLYRNAAAANCSRFWRWESGAQAVRDGLLRSRDVLGHTLYTRGGFPNWRVPPEKIQVIRPFQYWNLWWLGDPPFEEPPTYYHGSLIPHEGLFPSFSPGSPGDIQHPKTPSLLFWVVNHGQSSINNSFLWVNPQKYINKY